MCAWLHPEAASALQAAATRSRPSVHLMPVADAREAFEAESARTAPGPRLRSVEDLTIGSYLRARLYRPAAPATPVVLFFHGGGWVLGSVNSHDALCRTLAARAGCAVLSVDYRRAPEHPFPAAVDDAAAALAWVAARGEAHGLRPTGVAVAGDSAGGNIAAALAIRSRTGLRPRLQVLFYPVTTTDLDTGVEAGHDGLVLSREELAWHQDLYLPRPRDRRHPEASPLDSPDLAGLPPAVVLAAECDPIAPQSRRYAQALRTAGVPVDLHVYPGMIHGFAQYPDRFEAARDAIARAGRAVRRALAEPPEQQEFTT